jgi:hypothetical protein
VKLNKIVRLRNVALPACILVILACAKSQVKTYPAGPPSVESSVKSSPIPPLPSPVKPSAKTRPAPSSAKPSPIEPPRIKPPIGTYSETVSEWKSYQDLVRWMEKDFSFDANRFKKFEGTLPPPRTPEETFKLKSGIYIDAALFTKETLNRINPSYKAKIAVLIIRPYRANHYICSFQNGGKIFIMDYGTPFRGTTGTHGPYDSLEEVRKFYEKHFPVSGRIEAISYLP